MEHLISILMKNRYFIIKDKGFLMELINFLTPVATINIVIIILSIVVANLRKIIQ
jgi:hypothetical protein